MTEMCQLHASEKERMSNLSGQRVQLHTVECTVIVEVYFTEFGSLDHFDVEAAFQLHHKEKHVVVGSPRKQDLAGIELVQRAADRPHVQRCVIR